MALPTSGEIKASQINTEAGRSSNTEAPLSGNSATPQAGSLVKIYEDAGVNQSAPHSYSEFYGKGFTSLTLTNVLYGEGFGPDTLYYNSSIGNASNLAVGDIIYSDSGLTTPIGSDYNPMYQAGSSATTTHCADTNFQMVAYVSNANGALTSIACGQP